jgi:4-hydroxybenzoate polyprenyltransferase
LKKSGWTWFVLWSLPGIVVGFQVSTVGLFLLPIGLLVSLILFSLTGPGPELLGILEGVAIVCLVVVVLNADYWTCPPSGEVITRTRDTVTVESCGDLNPWPWLIAGLVFGVGAAIAYARSDRRGRERLG